jgi:hypothetical protein
VEAFDAFYGCVTPFLATKEGAGSTFLGGGRLRFIGCGGAYSATEGCIDAGYLPLSIICLVDC